MSVSSPYTWAVGEQVTAAKFNQHIRDNFKGIVPLGGYLMLPRVMTSVETIVEGIYAECNGVAISRTTYSDYDSLLAGLTPARPFGAGDGSTTVNLPDGKGRTLWAEGSHADHDLGDSDGVAAEASRSASHYHQIPRGNISGPGPNLTYDTNNQGVNATSGNGALLDKPANLTAGSWFTRVKY